MPKRMDRHLRQVVALDEVGEPTRDAVWLDRPPVKRREQPVGISPAIANPFLFAVLPIPFFFQHIKQGILVYLRFLFSGDGILIPQSDMIDLIEDFIPFIRNSSPKVRLLTMWI